METLSSSMFSPLLYQELRNLQSSRKLLQHSPPYQTLTASSTSPPRTYNPVDTTDPYSGTNGFDANVVMVLSVLLCALICSLGLNSIIKCALRCSSFVPPESNNDSSNPSPTSGTKDTGIKKKALKTFAVVNYSPNLKLPGLGTECVICLSEFAPGERLRLLPKCHHGFHIRCIDKWLNIHSSCPTCRHCLIETCQKIIGCDQASTSQPLPSQATIINMAPLEREDAVRSYSTS
ncbi:unnamed protein product [Amaranthus hypochondriacus]